MKKSCLPSFLLLAAFLGGAPAQASTTLTSTAGPPLTLDRAVTLDEPEALGSRFDLFAGDELARALDARARRESFHPSALEEEIYPKTRIRGFGLFGGPLVWVESTLSREQRWGYEPRWGKSAEGFVYPLQDELGSVERLTDATGGTLERYEYEGYGKFKIFSPTNAALSTSAYAWKWLFQGREYQTNLAAYDFRARTLWPEIGRFGQEDPAGTADTANRYQALRSSWPSVTDPDGFIGIFLDGTWNDQANVSRGDARTNVAKLRDAYQGEGWYIRGVGTQTKSPKTEGALGLGFKARVEEAYWVVSEAYRDGDRDIDIFGFSRGAAEARALANMIYKKGLIDPKTNARLADGSAVQIRFLGLFDTVDSRGGYSPTSYAAGDQGIPATVQNVRQATAQDEYRQSFGLVHLAAAGCPTDGRLVEKGFRGAHSDIGGGYEDGQLYKLPLEWMWQEARSAGVPFGELLPSDRPTAGLRALVANPTYKALVHDSMNGSDPIGWLPYKLGLGIARPSYSSIRCP